MCMSATEAVSDKGNTVGCTSRQSCVHHGLQVQGERGQQLLWSTNANDDDASVLGFLVAWTNSMS